jgi:hypothetical protein
LYQSSLTGWGASAFSAATEIEYIAAANGMVTGRSEDEAHYPEDVKSANGTAIKGESPSQNHIADWIDCMRSRKTPNATVELGYRSAVVPTWPTCPTGTNVD